MDNILVVGGAGYIGSHMSKCLAERGYNPIVFDNLSTGHREAAGYGPFIEGSTADGRLLEQVFAEHDISAVMHFAADCYVGESVVKPAKYYRNNVANTINLLNVMVSRHVSNFVFSSSCATYGEPVQSPMTEQHPQNPVNVYGRTKFMVEQVLRDFRDAYEFDYISFRYFNAAGADPEGEMGEDHEPETHLIPIVLQTALGQREKVTVFGGDYPTPDGTCVRDYIHISDLAQAHLLGLERLLGGHPGGSYNLGNGKGYSVKEVIDACCAVTGQSIPFTMAERRPGDPASLIASSQKAMTALGWQPEFGDLHTMIETAWKWHTRHPDGYGA
jgi:UDP-glucose 4-epimerase